MLPVPPNPLPRLWIDSDACPVKDEVLKVAQRHRLPVTLVGNRWMRGLDDPLVEQVVVPPNPDAADDVIADRVREGDLVVTADVPLAARCVARKALVLDPRGKAFDEASIGMALAMRDLMTHLRETGETTGGPAPYGSKDRSRFLDALERVVQQAKRARMG